MSEEQIVVGIDVGAKKKGFHAVALRSLTYVDQFESTDANEVAAWCRKIEASIVGIDAPCSWSTNGKARPAERELMRGGIGCFSSPLRAAALEHPKDNFGWMLNGEAMYLSLASTHPLFDGTQPRAATSICFETFPQAVACSLAGAIVSAKKKRSVRRDLLVRESIDIALLSNIDKVDAALCAVAAHYLAVGRYRTYGDLGTGLILVPRKHPLDGARGHVRAQ